MDTARENSDEEDSQDDTHENGISSEVSGDDTVGLYSKFSIMQKRLIVFLTAFASLFSPLSSFIYYPSITFIANDLHVSIEMVNLTITSYMIVSGIAPSLLGEMADTLGRRPIYLGVLAVYIAANVGLALQTSYPALLILRMLQSFGSSGERSLIVSLFDDVLTFHTVQQLSPLLTASWGILPVRRSEAHTRELCSAGMSVKQISIRPKAD